MKIDIKELYSGFKDGSVTPKQFLFDLLKILKKNFPPDDLIDELEALSEMATLSEKSVESFLVKLIEWGDAPGIVGKRLELIYKDEVVKDQLSLF